MSVSEIRVNTTKTRTGVGTITYTETGPVITGIATASNFKTGSTNVHSTGVELSNINTGGATATFGGPISGTTASFSGTVSIGGTLTYEDVTNIDSVGVITARNGIYLDKFVYHSGDLNTSFGFPNDATDTFTVNTSSLERLRIDSNGKIGINSTSPTYGMHLHGTSASNNAYYYAEQSSAGASAGFRLKTTGSHFAMYGAVSGSALGIYDYNAGAERFTIDSGGRVGVGTFAPHNSYRFDIRHTSDSILHLGQNNNTLAGMGNNSWNALSFQGTNCELGLYKDSSGNYSYIMGTYQGSIDIPLVFRTGNRAERLRIDSSGWCMLNTSTLGNNKNAKELVVSYNNTGIGGGDQGRCGITIRSGSNTSSVSQPGYLYFSDGTAGSNEGIGGITYDHDDDDMFFTTGGYQRVRIDSSGYVKLSGRNVQGSANGDKLLRIYQPSRTDAEEDVLLLQSHNTNTENWMTIGGGDSSFNAATDIAFRTAAVNTTSGTERLRIDSSGRVLIGGGSSPSQVGDGRLIVYADTRLHPAIKADCIDGGSNRANGFTMLADNYQADESLCNIGLAYSSGNLVLSRGCKVSNTTNNAFISSMDSFAIRPCALVLNEDGALTFNTTENTATTTTDSAVSITEVFQIDRVGNIYQRITNRYMYFGASNQLKVGIVSSDPVIDALSGHLQLKKNGSTVCTVRDDHLQLYGDIRFNAGKGVNFINNTDTATGETVSSSVLDEYEEGTWVPANQYLTITNNNTATYTKIGRIVTIQFDCTYASSPADTAQVGGRIEGLPFAAQANGFHFTPTWLNAGGSAIGDNESYNFLSFVEGGTGNKIKFYSIGNNCEAIRAQTAGKRVRGTVTYMASA